MKNKVSVKTGLVPAPLQAMLERQAKGKFSSTDPVLTDNISFITDFFLALIFISEAIALKYP